MYIKHELLLFLRFCLIHFFESLLHDFICNHLMTTDETFRNYTNIISMATCGNIRNWKFYHWNDAVRHVVHECR